MSQKLPFIIYSESTPNPSVVKFVSNKLLSNNTKECLGSEDAKGWPLLEKLFFLPFVKEVFINSNYISIKKHETLEWEEITNQIRLFIQTELNNNTVVCNTPILNKQEEKGKSIVKKNKITLEIENVINEYIKPSIQMDGGDIELFSFNAGIVKVYLKGACSGCPSSQMTLKDGIEVLLKEKFPNKIEEVIAINN